MTWKRFYFSNPPFSHFLTNATKSQRLPQPLETQNKSSNLLFFAFLVILFPKNLGSYEEKSYLCRRKAALGKLKASFLSARLHFLCRRKAALGKLKASFLCARLHFLCQRIAILRPRPDLIKRKQMANNIENQDKSKPVANCDQYICKLIFFSFISSIFHLNIWILKRKIVSLRHHLK